MVIYHMIMTQYILEPLYLWQNTHLAFSLVLVFLISMRGRGKKWILLTLLLIVISLLVTGYVKMDYDRLSDYIGWPTGNDTVIGVLLLIVVLEGGRRGQGLVFTVLALVFLGYAFLGQYLPHPLWHAPFPAERVVNMLTLGFSGVYGKMLDISAKYIFLFMLFGGLLQASGAAESFMPLARAVGRRLAGGAAHTAVVSSALVGMVAGTGMANAAITGAFTIPTMKNAGYSPEEAAAIEATASIGGQIMPPVMGAAAFVMVGFTGIPYSRIMLAAVIPAILYFLSIGIGVQLTAMKAGYMIPREEINWNTVRMRAPVFIVPLTILTVLLVMGYTPMFTAFYAVISIPAVSTIIGIFHKTARIPIKRWMNGLANGAIAGARIGAGIGCIGIAVGVITFSGLGPKFTLLIRMLSGGMVAPALVLTMVLCILLGMGIPVTAAYILVAVAVAPGLVRMGVDLLTAHFFAFYFCCIGAISPPIAGCCLVTAAMAGASYMKTAIKAFALATVGFMVPFLCVWNPFILGYSTGPLNYVTSTIAILGGTLCFHIVIHGQYFAATGRLERLSSLITIFGFFGYAFVHHYLLLAIGVALLGILTFSQLKKRGGAGGQPIKIKARNSSSFVL